MAAGEYGMAKWQAAGKWPTVSNGAARLAANPA